MFLSKLGLSFALSLFLPCWVYAGAVVTDVDGASRWTEANDSTITEVFGGMGGNSCSGDNTETCNNCESGELEICNTHRIYPSLQLAIYFVDEDAAGYTYVSGPTDETSVSFDTDESTSSRDKGETHKAVITWSNLCSLNDSSGSSCTATFSQKIRVGVRESATASTFSGTPVEVNIRVVVPDSAKYDGTNPYCEDSSVGICSFTAYPGDQKVYIEDPHSEDSNFPSGTDVQFKYFKVIFSTEGFDKQYLNPRDAMDAGMDEDLVILEGEEKKPDIEDAQVRDLENNKVYYFRGMIVDEALNIMEITSDDAYTSEPDCPDSVTAEPTEEQIFECPYIAQPDAVIGLLKEDLNCYITTATYGSIMHPTVKDFRTFRNKILLGKPWGRKVIHYYNLWGPTAAKYVNDNVILKYLSRALLLPAWAFSKLSLIWSLKSAVGLSVLLLLSSFFALRWKFKKKLQNV